MKIRPWCIVLFVCCVYGLFYEEGSWNQNVRIGGVFSFVEPGTPDTHTFRLNRFTNTTEGWRRNLASGDVSMHGNDVYSNKAPGSTLLATLAYFPLYYLENARGVDITGVRETRQVKYLLNFFAAIVPAGMAVALLYAFHRRRMQRCDAIWAAGVFAFGTLLLPYASSFWGHVTAASFSMMALTMLRTGAPGEPITSTRRLTLAGLLAGAAVLTEYTCLFGFALTLIYVFAEGKRPLDERFRSSFLFGVGGAPPALALLVYQKACFGGFLVSAASRSDVTDNYFHAPSLETFVSLFGSPGRGLLWFMPVFLFVFGGADRLFASGERRWLGFCLANVLAHLAFISCYAGWHGGLAAGPRYLIVTVPFLCMLLPPRSTLPLPSRIAYTACGLTSAVSMFALARWGVMHGSGNSASAAESLLSDAYAAWLAGEPSHLVWQQLPALVPFLAALAGLSVVLVVSASLRRRRSRRPRVHPSRGLRRERPAFLAL